MEIDEKSAGFDNVRDLENMLLGQKVREIVGENSRNEAEVAMSE